MARLQQVRRRERGVLRDGGDGLQCGGDHGGRSGGYIAYRILAIILALPACVVAGRVGIHPRRPGIIARSVGRFRCIRHSDTCLASHSSHVAMPDRRAPEVSALRYVSRFHHRTGRSSTY